MFLSFFHSLLCGQFINDDEFQLQNYFLLLKNNNTSHLAIEGLSFFSIHHHTNQTCTNLAKFTKNFLYEPVQLSWAYVQNFIVLVLPDSEKK